jgi:hypothetical protein
MQKINLQFSFLYTEDPLRRTIFGAIVILHKERYSCPEGTGLFGGHSSEAPNPGIQLRLAN